VPIAGGDEQRTSLRVDRGEAGAPSPSPRSRVIGTTIVIDVGVTLTRTTSEQRKPANTLEIPAEPSGGIGHAERATVEQKLAFPVGRLRNEIDDASESLCAVE